MLTEYFVNNERTFKVTPMFWIRYQGLDLKFIMNILTILYHLYIYKRLHGNQYEATELGYIFLGFYVLRIYFVKARTKNKRLCLICLAMANSWSRLAKKKPIGCRIKILVEKGLELDKKLGWMHTTLPNFVLDWTVLLVGTPIQHLKRKHLFRCIQHFYISITITIYWTKDICCACTLC